MHVGVMLVLALVVSADDAHGDDAEQAQALRLVPFPKEVQLEQGTFALDRPLLVEAPAELATLFGELLGAELKRAKLPVPEVRGAAGSAHRWRWSIPGPRAASSRASRAEATPEDYTLQVCPDEVTCVAAGSAGLYYGLQTLLQLVRANRRDGGLPCLTIRDWPSLRWRCFQDDLTRGPSSTLDTLKLQTALGSHFKMNLITYYMEYQYHFQKHPQIGPPDGSLEPEDLRAWVDFGQRLHVGVLGNQQSFGHFGRILQHDEFAALRETPDVLSPVKEESYQLLDDIYSEVCPLLPFPFFNVCCDETWGLGTGPSKELAAQIGVGGVYVRHIRRVHDLLKDKYQKRMMMWGDIILQHPDQLDQIPKDTIMLTWGYDARPSFEDQILPFTKSGYEFFVCPGVSNWSRILPDFGVATVNIHNFVRDGVQHGAIGMLNTEWEDDGEAINAPKWHGYAWGAECAWNASATTPEQFNRRLGAVLFGEPEDHFGRAVEGLAQTHRLAGMQGMNNSRFWENDFKPARNPVTIRSTGQRLLDLVQPAITDLEACRNQATVNAQLLDAFLFGARRMELIGQRMLDGLDASELYNRAYEVPPQEALPLLAKIETLVRKNRDAHEALGQQFQTLWLSESKPYALDLTMKRYANVIQWYTALLERLANAHQQAAAGERLPRPEEVGLEPPETFARRTRPQDVLTTSLEPSGAWAEPTATHRLGLTIRPGNVDRFELPLELDVALPVELAARPIRAFLLQSGQGPEEILGQLDPSHKPGKTRLTLLVPGRLPTGSETNVSVYLGLSQVPQVLPSAALTTDAPDGKKWLENNRVRLLLGSEGGHLYRWEVKGLQNRDVTMPGETSWSGFSDVHSLRAADFQLTCTARGPALVRYACGEAAGLVKTISLFGGVSWVEVLLNEGTAVYWEFDDPRNFAADGPTPGKYLFSTGATGEVGKQADGVSAQVKAPGAFWSIKFNPERLGLGLATPEVAAHHCLAPGAGAGGVGLEQSPEASHFVTYAGLLEAEPAETMNRLRATLDLKNQPLVIVHALQAKP